MVFIKLIAHRGIQTDGTKENSLESFQKTIQDERFIGFELDIRTSQDGVFMVHHNIFIHGILFRLLTSQELKEQYNIPSLESVLKLNTDKIILIEIKESNLNVKELTSLINRYSNSNIYIDSFDNNIIKKLKQEGIQAKLGVLNYVLNSENNYEDYDFIGLLSPIVTDKLLTYFQEKNIEIFLYGIKNLKDAIENEKIYYIIDEARLPNNH